VTTQGRERFQWRRWEYPYGTKRHTLWCNACGYPASGSVDSVASADDHMKAAALHECPLVMFSWDFWRRVAWHAGMVPETADVGRLVIREHHQHAWNVPIDTAAMMANGLKSPRAARRSWQRLLDEHARAELT
jgi:hypothetical protein